MIQKKICIIGPFAVGKTSLFNRFTKSIFSEKYLTTVGVKIDKKLVRVFDQDVNLILWDIHGEDDFQEISMTYLRGTSGYLLVVDGTRRSTLEKSYLIHRRINEEYGNIPFVIALNKSDLKDDWEINENDRERILKSGWKMMETSAKTGEGVEQLFIDLTKELVTSE